MAFIQALIKTLAEKVKLFREIFRQRHHSIKECV